MQLPAVGNADVRKPTLEPLTRQSFRAASSILPWSVSDVSVQPFEGDWWSFNPSVHYDLQGQVWRCVFRIANYSLPDGTPRLSTAARAGRAESRNVVATLDPVTWQVVDLTEVRERDDLAKTTRCASMGYEDVRMFRTQTSGLCGVATVLQFNAEHPGRPEVALFRFDEEMAIRHTRVLRGPWSYRAQKNWAPFDGSVDARLLYSIERGVVMDEDGPVDGSPEPVPSAPPRATQPVTARGAEVKVGARVVTNAPPKAATRRERSDELRGGSQLVRVGQDRWIGIAHEMALVTAERKKLYWHTFYSCDGNGVLREVSEPFKLEPDRGIEFAAGLAVDERGRVAVSYGVDDQSSWIARTSLPAVLDLLRPVGTGR